MRKILTLIAIACSVLSLKAQTLTRAELPDVGDLQIYRKADTAGVVEGPAGSGQSWTFGGLIPTSVVGTNRYINPTGHPQGSFYATADLCYSPFNDAWAFYEDDVDSIKIIGEKSLTNTRIVYTDGGVMYRFPQGFGVANTDSVKGDYPDGFISTVTRKGLYMTTFDGEGTLVTPFNSYPSVKRIEIIGIHRDSSWTGAAESDVFIKRYEWYAAGSSMPVMIIHHQMIILNNGNPQVSKDVLWADPTAIAADQPFEGSFGLSPNPSNGHTSLQYTLDAGQDVSVEVLSVLGERVRLFTPGLQAAGNHEMALDLSGIAQGIYFVKLNTAQGTATKKLLVE